MNPISCECCILGAGPAGLGTAQELVGNGVTDILIIDKNKIVGGLSRTEIFDDARFDIGPHRFFTKHKEVKKLWHNVLGNDFKLVDRFTRIYYKKKYFSYPINPVDLLMKLGPLELMHAFLSYANSQLNSGVPILNLEDWVIKKFGRKLYVTFFKTYTEKIWGIPCDQMSRQWAEQRIKGLDTSEVLRKALKLNKKKQINTLIEQFEYPVLGAGQMYEVMTDKLVSKGIKVMLNARAVKIENTHETVKSVDVLDPAGNKLRVTAKHFFSSIPLKHFFNMLCAAGHHEIKQSVKALRYRDHITVNLLINGKKLFPDQWIYIHEPDMRLARLVNYNNFSESMAGAKNVSVLSSEYFAFKDQGIWNESDAVLKEFAIAELEKTELLKGSRVENAWVVKETEAYPMHYTAFEEHYQILKKRVDEFTNLSMIGRAGLHQYNNMDHSILSGMLAARNYLRLPESPYNLWNINVDAEYLESDKRGDNGK